MNENADPYIDLDSKEMLDESGANVYLGNESLMAAKTIRDKLVVYFSDNATPTGDDFKAFIESAVIQDDDHISIDNNAVNIASDLNVAGQVSVNGGQALLASQQLNVGENLRFDEQNGLQVNRNIQAGQNLDVEGDINVMGESALKSDLTVEGDVVLKAKVSVEGEQVVAGDVQLDQALHLGTPTTAGQINLQHQGDTNSLLIKETEGDTTQLCLDGDGNLSLGLDEGQAQAKLHIYHVGSNSEALLKVDNSAQDARPFIVNGDGRVGIATDSPENALDVAGSMRIGCDIHTVHEDSSLSVENKIGVGTHSPEARMDIHAKPGEDALRVRYGSENTLSVTQNLITTDVNTSLLVGGDTHFEQQLTVLGETNLNNSTYINGSFEANYSASFNDRAMFKQQADFNGPVSINSEGDDSRALAVRHQNETTEQTVLTVRGDKVGVLCDEPQKDFHVAGEVQVDGDMHLQANLDVAANINAQGAVRVEQTMALGLAEETPNDARLHIALPEAGNSVTVAGSLLDSPTFTIQQDFVGIHQQAPRCALDVMGDTSIQGNLQINELFNVSTDTLTLQQQKGLVALNIQSHEANMEEGGEAHYGVQLSANSFSLNIREPQANFHMRGTAQFDGSITGAQLRVTEQLSVNGPSEFTDQLTLQGKMSINTLQSDDSVDLHLRQSELNQTALRVDPSEGETASLLVTSGRVGINTNTPQQTLDVRGSARIANALTVNETLTVDGETRLKQTVSIDQNMGFSVAEPQARLHINNIDPDETALRIDSMYSDTESPLVFKQGMLGLGYSNPKVRLDVKGDASISDELTVNGQTKLKHTLQVKKDVLFKSDMMVHKDSELIGQTVLGTVSEIDPTLTPGAQLYIADTRYKEALRIDSCDYASLVFCQGKLGIGKTDPRVTLDVMGEFRVTEKAELEKELEVDGDITARNNISVGGGLNVARRVDIGDDTHIRGNTELNAGLLVKQQTILAGPLEVSGDALFMSDTLVAGTLNVSQNIHIEKDLHVNGAIHTGVGTAQAHLHLQSGEEETAFILDKKSATGSRRLLTVDSDGQLGLGTDQPSATLDVIGNACISQQLTAHSAQIDNRLNTRELNVNGHLQMKDGPLITAISDDTSLGGESSLHSVLPTQAAVKAYIDSVAVPFAQGGRTYTVHNQRGFDEIFNRGDDTAIAAYTTVILMPLDKLPLSAYSLKNNVRLREGTTIVGFNDIVTRIVKQTPNARFEIIGSPEQPVKDIALSGFCFDGANLQSSRDGGAFYLEHVRDCQLNCRIENHATWGDGGALFAPVINEVYSVFNIEALHIHNCRATDQGSGSDTQLNEGGAAYGLARSRIHAYHCQAERGGAVAKCDDSQVEAYHCFASRSGGAAYRCTLLRLLAKDCRADMNRGKGGAAYFCSDLICEGLWTGNNAGEAPHIYASNHLTDASEERHYWQGNYVGRRIDDDVSVWRSHNE